MLEEAEWKEGINAFRMQIMDALAVMHEQIRDLQMKIEAREEVK